LECSFNIIRQANIKSSSSAQSLNTLDLGRENRSKHILVHIDCAIAMGKEFEVADFDAKNGRVRLVFLRELAVLDVDNVLTLHNLLIDEIEASQSEKILFHVEEDSADAKLFEVVE